MGFKGDRSGATSIIEEMPALVMVIVGVGMLLASSLHGYAGYVSAMDEMDLREEAGDFLDAVLSWDRITGDGTGFLDLDALSGCTDEELLEAFHPDSIGLDYQIAFLEAGSRPDMTRRVMGSGEPPVHGDVAVVWGTAVGVDGFGCRRPVQVVAYVW